jgi:hypothetical protein
MLFKKTREIVVQDITISIINVEGHDYICLTDMVKSKDGEFHVKDWLRNRNTLEFLSIWENENNSDFNWGEFALIKTHAGLNSFKISTKEWIERTHAKGIVAKAGRYGGTYAHKDIALQFGTWISAEFQYYLIKEYERLKNLENNPDNIAWQLERILARTNHRLHTDAIKEHIAPSVWRKDLAYAEEVDLLNVVVFGCTAKQWEKANPSTHKKGANIRDSASANELNILANLQAMNAEWIREGLDKKARFEKMKDVKERQHLILEKSNPRGNTKKETEIILLPKSKS